MSQPQDIENNSSNRKNNLDDGSSVNYSSSPSLPSNQQQQSSKNGNIKNQASVAQPSTFSPHPTLMQISEILQHSVELKLCSSVSTHSVVWDTLMHNVECNPDIISLIITILLTKYIQLSSMLDKRSTPLISILMSLLTSNNNNNNIIQNNNGLPNIMQLDINGGANGGSDESASDEDSGEDEISPRSVNNTQSPSNNNQVVHQQIIIGNNVYSITNSPSSKEPIITIEPFDANSPLNSNNIIPTAPLNSNIISGSNNNSTVNSIPSSPPQTSASIGQQPPTSPVPSMTNSSNGVNSGLTSPNQSNSTPLNITSTSTPIPPTPVITLSSEEQKEIDSMKLSIVTTLTFIALFNNFNSNNPALKFVLGKYGDLIAKDANTADLLRILSPSFKDSNDYIFYLVDRCSDLSTVAEPQKSIKSWLNTSLTNLLQQAPSASAASTIAGSVQQSKTKMIFDNLFLFLKHPLLLEKRMLYFLQMLKHYLLVSPIVPPSIISTALSIVKTYYMWPRPYCDFANDILETLTIEYQCPGSYFRAMLANEMPSVMQSPSSNQNSTSPLAASIYQMKNRPIVHMLVDRYNSEALSIQEIFEHNIKNSSTPSIAQLQANNIANIYQRILGIDNTALGLEFIDPLEIAHFHLKIIDILNKTMFLDENESKSVRIKELSSIREEMIQISRKTLFRHTPQNTILPNLFYHFSSLYRISIKNKKPDEFSTQFNFPVYKKTMNLLINLLSNYQEEQYNQTIKICIVGNDASIHHLVGSYVYLSHHSPELFTDLDIQFYLIPAGNNCKFTDFISSFDSWYQRQVSTILSSLYEIIPTFRPSSNIQSDQSVIESMSGIKEDRKSMSFRSQHQQQQQQQQQLQEQSEDTTPNTRTPSSIIMSEVEYLFREASFKMDIPLMKCEGWNEDTYQTIPFFHSAEIGLNAYCQGTGDTTLIESSLPNRMTKYPPVFISAKIGIVNPLGTQIQQIVLDYKNYYEISVVNQFPKSSIKEKFPAIMELGLIEFDSKKKRLKSEEPTTFSINYIEIECQKDERRKPFDILLDGQLCGPYTKIRISFCNIADEILHLPIMTFLPYF